MEFEKAPIREYPGYIFELEEIQNCHNELHANFKPGKIRGAKAQNDYYWLRGETPPNSLKLWVWDTFPWDPGG